MSKKLPPQKKIARLRSMKPMSVGDIVADENTKHKPKDIPLPATLTPGTYTLSGLIKFADDRILIHPLKHDFATEEECHTVAEKLQCYLACVIDIVKKNPEATALVLAADKTQFNKIYAEMTKGLIERGIDPMTGKAFQ